MLKRANTVRNQFSVGLIFFNTSCSISLSCCPLSLHTQTYTEHTAHVVRKVFIIGIRVSASEWENAFLCSENKNMIHATREELFTIFMCYLYSIAVYVCVYGVWYEIILFISLLFLFDRADIFVIDPIIIAISFSHSLAISVASRTSKRVRGVSGCGKFERRIIRERCGDRMEKKKIKVENENTIFP